LAREGNCCATGETRRNSFAFSSALISNQSFVLIGLGLYSQFYVLLPSASSFGFFFIAAAIAAFALVIASRTG